MDVDATDGRTCVVLGEVTVLDGCGVDAGENVGCVRWLPDAALVAEGMLAVGDFRG